MAGINTEQFIAAVRARPLLYQRQHDEYNEPESKQRAWRDVAAAVYSDWDQVGRSETYERVLLLQKKWRSLRDAFNRELRLSARGAATGSRSRKKYVHYDQLRFLRHENASAADGDSSSSAEDPLQVSQVSQPTPAKRRRARDKRPSVKHEADERDYATGDVVEFDALDSCDPVANVAVAHQEAEGFSDRLFLVSYAEEMRRLPAAVRMWARAQVSRVMQHAVAFCCAERTSGAPLVPADVDLDALDLPSSAPASAHNATHAADHF